MNKGDFKQHFTMALMELMKEYNWNGYSKKEQNYDTGNRILEI